MLIKLDCMDNFIPSTQECIACTLASTCTNTTFTCTHTQHSVPPSFLHTLTGSPGELNVVLKSKPTDMETANMINKMAVGCGLTLAIIYEKYKMETGFK